MLLLRAIVSPIVASVVLASIFLNSTVTSFFLAIAHVAVPIKLATLYKHRLVHTFSRRFSYNHPIISIILFYPHCIMLLPLTQLLIIFLIPPFLHHAMFIRVLELK